MAFLKNPYNYMGGKFKLLPQIYQHLPDYIDAFYDICVGGGDVTMNIVSDNYYANDKSKSMYGMHTVFQRNPLSTTLSTLDDIVKAFKLDKLSVDGYNSLVDTLDATAVSDMYYYMLYIAKMYTWGSRLGILADGRFRRSWGCLHKDGYSRGYNSGYNPNLRKRLIEYIEFIQRNEVMFTNTSFELVAIDELRFPNCLVYVDPPYWSTATGYEDSWLESDELRLLAWLDELNERGIRFMLSNVLNAGGSSGRANIHLTAWLNARKDVYNVHDIFMSYNNSLSSIRHKKNSLVSADTEILVTNFST